MSHPARSFIALSLLATGTACGVIGPEPEISFAEMDSDGDGALTPDDLEDGQFAIAFEVDWSDGSSSGLNVRTLDVDAYGTSSPSWNLSDGWHLEGNEGQIVLQADLSDYANSGDWSRFYGDLITADDLPDGGQGYFYSAHLARAIDSGSDDLYEGFSTPDAEDQLYPVEMTYAGGAGYSGYLSEPLVISIGEGDLTISHLAFKKVDGMTDWEDGEN